MVRPVIRRDARSDDRASPNMPKILLSRASSVVEQKTDFRSIPQQCGKEKSGEFEEA
jgi:hypothetical protein